jgi:molybdenum cofactor cytidylyltransferase
VRATAEAEGWLILPADLPLIQPDTLKLIAAASLQHDVVVPVYQGQRGHPVRFSRACGPQLMALQGNQGAAPVVRARGATELVVDDAGCVTDIDTLPDLLRAQQILQARQRLLTGNDGAGQTRA